MKRFLLVSFSLATLVSYSQEKDYDLQLGGAIRMNYFIKSWDDENKKKGGELAYDMMRFDVEANYNNVIASGQIRFYSNAFGGVLLHHAYMGYIFKDKSEIHLGIDQVPFGIQTYASNNWFFNIGYYVGLEDDYDLGVQYITQKDKLGIKIAFFKNSEFPSNEFSRYSYDITGTHQEINQFNFKLTYNLSNTELGASAQLGQLEEVATGDLGNHSAYAVHSHSKLGKINIKLQASYFDINPRGPVTDLVYMSAYGAEYETTTEAFLYTIGLMYSIPLDKGPLKSLDIYNDFGLLDKQKEGQENSIMNVLGTGVNMGKLYTYIDAAFGRNHSWIGPVWPNAFSTGDPNAKWHLRYNMNFGYYF